MNVYVILAKEWRAGLEYAHYRDGREAPQTVAELDDGVVWSTGVPAWASGDRPIVVREAGGAR